MDIPVGAVEVEGIEQGVFDVELLLTLLYLPPVLLAEQFSLVEQVFHLDDLDEVSAECLDVLFLDDLELSQVGPADEVLVHLLLTGLQLRNDVFGVPLPLDQVLDGLFTEQLDLEHEEGLAVDDDLVHLDEGTLDGLLLLLRHVQNPLGDADPQFVLE